jgi:hypothetical protein
LSKDHFNRDLDDYIHRKKNGSKSGFSIKLGSTSKERGILDATMTSKKNLDKKISEAEIRQAMESKSKDPRMPELEPEEEPVTAPREGFFSKIFGGMFAGREADEDVSMDQVQEQAPVEKKVEVSPDVAEVLKIAGKWLNRLDAETRAEFKNSTDYAKYKYLLDKLKKQ